MSVSEEALVAAIRAAVAAHPEGCEAGPKALLAAVQEANKEGFASLGFLKFKKIFAKVKKDILEEEEEAKKEAAKPKVGSIENCPGRHGLTRFTTNHGSYCCDTCRCYMTIGAPMWGCRICDWDVCEGRCHPVGECLSDLRSEHLILEGEIDALVTEAPTDLKTKLALVEAKVHKLEKKLDNSTVANLVKISIVTITEEEARVEKKRLIAAAETLLGKIEGSFAKLRLNGGLGEGGETPLPEQANQAEEEPKAEVVAA